MKTSYDLGSGHEDYCYNLGSEQETVVTDLALIMKIVVTRAKVPS